MKYLCGNNLPWISLIMSGTAIGHLPVPGQDQNEIPVREQLIMDHSGHVLNSYMPL